MLNLCLDQVFLFRNFLLLSTFGMIIRPTVVVGAHYVRNMHISTIAYDNACYNLLCENSNLGMY